MDLLQLLAPAELPRVLDVLGEGAIQNGDFQSVFDQFLEADIDAEMGQVQELFSDQELLEGVLETLTDEQASLLMSFLVQVQFAIEDPSLHLEGLMDKNTTLPELEHEVPGSPGFAMRSLELAFEFSTHQVENEQWTKEEAIEQLSAYLKHWLRHEPCLDCKEPKFFAAHELIPADEYLKRIEAEKKILPQKQKPTDMFLLPTQKSNFKIPFFTTFKVEEVHAKPVLPLQAEVQSQSKELQKTDGEAKVNLDLENPEEMLIDGDELGAKLVEGSGKSEVSPTSDKPTESSVVQQKNVSVPQVQNRVEKVLDWFATQIEQIGQPEEMEDQDWQKIVEWMQAKKTKSATEAMQQLDRLGQLKRMNSESAQNDSSSKTHQEFSIEELEPKKSKNVRLQRVFAEAYQVVKNEETVEKAQDILKNYTPEKSELPEAAKVQKQTMSSQPDSSNPALGQAKSVDLKSEHTPTTPKFTPPPSSNWDPELLNKFLHSTKENLKIWVEKKYVAMRIQIEPAELGKIHLKTIVEQGRIGVLIQAENQMTKELLQIHLHEMKEILKQQGLEVAGFQVDVKEQQYGSSQQKSSSGSKFELETLLEDDNNGTELSSAPAKGLIDQVA
jgi:flagellar hook-length control protein FliK